MKEEAIKIARMESAKLERLYKAKMKLSELLYVILNGDPFMEDPLKEAMVRLTGQIFCKETVIRKKMGEILSSEKYLIPSYITVNERTKNAIDVTKFPEKEDTHTLCLLTGEILVSKSDALVESRINNPAPNKA
jgi:hypothetical protein